ncbi:Hbr2 [Desulfamplus magnetovallimortis]|uniref:Hbr2 n=1 Tax=Desulfamplus magnetovallimortis TaxID=1246637 RepID=A0A1W1H821_9BACT|nr:DUF2231 domain-containing protein [Desulfamplus magnetovallimortis]SLM28627.1 Hbr2 [Desulfamplus magnetovallimortis]
MKKWRCTICNYVHEGETPPEKCPICKAPASKFVLMEPSADEISAMRIKELEKQIAEQKIIIEQNKGKMAKLYDKFQDLIVKHHAHPISVHFPNGLLPVAVLLFVLAILLKMDTLSYAGFYNLFFVMITLPFVLFAGYAEWIRKYNKAMTSLFVIKIAAAALTTILCIFNVLWYLVVPDVLSSSLAWLFIIFNIVMLAGAGIAGHLGGKLVFKD